MQCEPGQEVASFRGSLTENFLHNLDPSAPAGGSWCGSLGHGATVLLLLQSCLGHIRGPAPNSVLLPDRRKQSNTDQDFQYICCGYRVRSGRRHPRTLLRLSRSRREGLLRNRCRLLFFPFTLPHKVRSVEQFVSTPKKSEEELPQRNISLSSKLIGAPHSKRRASRRSTRTT